MLITGLALAVFTAEGLMQNKRKVKRLNRINNPTAKYDFFCNFS